MTPGDMLKRSTDTTKYARSRHNKLHYLKFFKGKTYMNSFLGSCPHQVVVHLQELMWMYLLALTAEKLYTYMQIVMYSAVQFRS